MASQSQQEMFPFLDHNYPNNSEIPGNDLKNTLTQNIQFSNPMGTQHKLVSVSSENNEYKINSQQTVFEEYKNDVGDDSECSYGQSGQGQNGQQNQFENSEEDSVDLLMNFIFKLHQMFSNQVNKILKNTFLKLCESDHTDPKMNQQKLTALKVQKQNSEEQKIQNGFTLKKNKGTQYFDSPFSSVHHQEKINSFHFNSNIKRKSIPPLSSLVNIAQNVSIFKIKTCPSANFQQNILQNWIQQDNFHSSKPILRLLPDCLKEENKDQLGVYDFQINYECPLKQYRNQYFTEMGMRSMQVRKKQFQKENSQQKTRPISFLVNREKPILVKPVNNVKVQMKKNDSSNRVSLRNTQYGIMKNTDMKRQEVNEKRKESPFQKINITYQNKSPEIKRSHSEYIRDKSPIFSVIHHHNIQQINKINAINSQYYLRKDVENVTNNDRRIISSPVKQNHLRKRVFTQEHIRQNQHLRKKSQTQLMVQNYKKKTQREYENQYYNFTRPKNTETNISSSLSSFKSGKVKKISVMSAKPENHKKNK